MPQDTEAHRAQLVEAYQECSELQQKLIQLLSIAYAPIDHSTLGECFNLYRIDGDYEKPLNLATVRTQLKQLQGKKLVMNTGGQGRQCHPLLVEIATRDALRAGRFEPMVRAVQERQPVHRIKWNQNLLYFTSVEQFIREVRIGLYRGDFDYIQQQYEAYSRNTYAPLQISLSEVLVRICSNPFDIDWFRTLNSDPILYQLALFHLLHTSWLSLASAHDAFALLEADFASDSPPQEEQLRILWVEQLLLRGRLADAETFMAQDPYQQPDEWLLHQGWLHCLLGEYDRTIDCGEKALAIARQAHGKRKLFFNNLPGVFFVLALIQSGTPPRLQEAADYAAIITKQHDHWLSILYDRLETVIAILQGDISQKGFLLAVTGGDVEAGHSFENLISMLCLYWVDLDAASEVLPQGVERFYQQAQEAGYRALALEAAAIRFRLIAPEPTSNDLDYDEIAQVLAQQTGITPLATLLTPKAAWELSLNALIGLAPQSSESKATPTDYRLAWFITFFPSVGWRLQPREQKITKRGTWSKGRMIAPRRLATELESFDYLTPQDIQVCSHIKADYRSYGSYDPYTFQDGAIAALVGHPLVFWEDAPTTQVEVVEGEPQLLVKQKKGGWLVISLDPPVPADSKSSVVVTKETPTRLRVVPIKPEHRRIADILGPKNRLQVPEAAQERVLSAISAVSGIVTIHSDIGGGVENAEAVPSDPRPHVHLLPAGDGLKVALLNRPFPGGGPYYRPGAGGEMVVAEIEGKRLQTQRDLKQEKKLARAVEKGCPTLQRYPDQDGEWLLDEPEACLELLLELQDLGDQVVVEWPEGEKFRIAQRAGLNNFNLRINRQRDWFAASGELTVGDDQVLDMQKLLELLENSPSRFIALENGQFLALTQEFRQRLEDLRAYSEKNGKERRLHPLTALTMEDWVEDVGNLKTDKHWREHIQRLREVETLQPKVPSTLQAELRDYQVEGFEWLARLAHWGVGGCLADDMGLGKTLQSLAVILTRAPEGPTLIVAPTSVGMNWLGEAERFAPTLNPINFRDCSDRAATLDNLQAFDMVVCSYGLLQQEDVAEMLSAVNWRTIVLDEAQAIKNTATKRSKGAMNLKGDFKLITTGTPIENHLGELWNLFRFINPGLLGSQDHFNQKFATPIERYQDKAARDRLKRLIQPFILRRTKAQVLNELPARTEITLQVELSQRELAFYEALRRDAVEKLTATDADAGAKHLQVLAEIMRLRRACCNPQLVQADAAIPSSKLETFSEVLEELLSNHHKALVFSQFVDHLKILREHLESQKISYQYLDGSTSAKARKQRVDAFQAGEGEVFLISLKAGGTGLNLTAADYVIHMDPWWNPAVEDQASDRAHRIGQQRPVTIYRLVAQGTIEEKIVDLHKQKRDLADSLLEGTDMSGKMSTDQLLKLISAG